jgi:predicted 3-demethylubiquinone-9 3-methyltransferase (glyoxalase superfamily)
MIIAERSECARSPRLGHALYVEPSGPSGSQRALRTLHGNDLVQRKDAVARKVSAAQYHSFFSLESKADLSAAEKDEADREDRNERVRADRAQKEHTQMTPKNTICLWFDTGAVDAARFYAATFPDSEVTAVHEAPSDYPGGKKGDVLTVEFTVLGIPCLGLNGGPAFKHSEAFSFQIATDNQEETDRYWNAIVNNGGEESACGWCKDRWGLSWQITPRVMTDALAAGGDEARRAFEAMMTMKKIDVAAIEAARRG